MTKTKSKVDEAPEKKAETKTGEFRWNFPQKGFSVMAKSYDEALKKAEKREKELNNSKE